MSLNNRTNTHQKDGAMVNVSGYIFYKKRENVYGSLKGLSTRVYVAYSWQEVVKCAYAQL
jgi:hypothetical protein